jgi:hypothetical protein
MAWIMVGTLPRCVDIWQDGRMAQHHERRHPRLRIIVWMVLTVVVAKAARLATRWQLAWGATAAERERHLPGDDLVSRPGLEATRAIGIDAPPASVWPWLVQIGQDRGGFYSLDWLENLFGLNIHSADQVVSAWQNLAVGDQVTLGGPVQLEVVQLAPEHHLVLAVSPPDAATHPPFPQNLEFTWAFVVEPEGPTGSRLLIRERYAWHGFLAAWAVRAISWVSWLMTRAMLRGLRQRAEHS